MDKKFILNVLAVLVGLAVFVMIVTTVSMIFEAVLSGDIATISSIGEDEENLVSYIRGASIGIFIYSVAALASYCFTYFTKSKKIFGCISAGLSLFLAVLCIAIVFDMRKMALETTSASTYAEATAYFSGLITVTIVALLLCAFFTIITVKAFTAERAGTQPANVAVAETEEENSNEAE